MIQKEEKFFVIITFYPPFMMISCFRLSCTVLGQTVYCGSVQFNSIIDFAKGVLWQKKICKTKQM